MQKIIIASGPVIIENDKVLLDMHGEDDFWKFCGGRVREDEDLTQAAIGRAKEELGIDVEILDQQPFLMHVTKEKDRQKIDVVLVHFLAKAFGEIKPASEVREWRWIAFDELEKEKLAPNILPVLKYFKFIE
jgi:ADP-ribose pyrophosphatase YjhB (NUDIX family)